MRALVAGPFAATLRPLSGDESVAAFDPEWTFLTEFSVLAGAAAATYAVVMSSDQHRVTVTLATLAEKPLIEGLSQFYIYDFSEMGPTTADFPFNADGRLNPLPDFDEFWRREGWHALVIRCGVETAGFALLNNHSHLTGGEVERNMGEFFVARGFRRRGVATQAVHQILAAYPGRWETAVVERNLAAKSFWPKAIAAAPNVSDLFRHEGDGEHWRGPIWSFLAS